MKNELKADKNMQMLKIGMTKEEVISIMGTTYKAMEAKQTDNGYKEVIGYVDWQNGIYRLSLVNGRLSEWNYILLPPYRHDDSTPANPHQ